VEALVNGTSATTNDDDFADFRSASGTTTSSASSSGHGSNDHKSVTINVSTSSGSTLSPNNPNAGSSGIPSSSSGTFPHRSGFVHATPLAAIDPDSLLSQPFDDDGIAPGHRSSLLSLSASSSGRERIWLYHRHKIIAAVAVLIILIIIIAIMAAK
jgi:hypothetical protein